MPHFGHCHSRALGSFGGRSTFGNLTSRPQEQHRTQTTSRRSLPTNNLTWKTTLMRPPIEQEAEGKAHGRVIERHVLHELARLVSYSSGLYGTGEPIDGESCISYTCHRSSSYFSDVAVLKLSGITGGSVGSLMSWHAEQVVRRQGGRPFSLFF